MSLVGGKNALISFRSLDVLRDAINLYFSSCALTGGVPLSDGLLDFILSSSLPTDTKLTHKQAMFVNEYLVDLNATQAAIRAGYSEHTAHDIGCENLKKPNVAAAIFVAMEERADRTGITADKVLSEISKLGFANMHDYMTVNDDGYAYVNLSDLTREQAAAIQEMTVDSYYEGKGDDAREVKKVKFKLADKKGNLELLGKHLKLFTEKQEISGPGGKPIENKWIVEVVKAPLQENMEKTTDKH